MGFNVEIKCNIDIPKHMKKLQDPTFWKFAAVTWHKLYSEYVPKQTGTLYKQVVITPNQIEHTAPYAVAVYGRNANFRKDFHSKASKEWDKAAIPTERDKLIESMQNYIDSGRLKLNE